jgi:hypothetical protein
MAASRRVVLPFSARIRSKSPARANRRKDTWQMLHMNLDRRAPAAIAKLPGNSQLWLKASGPRRVAGRSQLVLHEKESDG